MDEIFAITDEISVFRDGFGWGAKTPPIYPPVADHPDGGPRINPAVSKFNNTIGEEVLTVRNLTRQGVFHDVSFSVRRGEITGVAGLVGAGRSGDGKPVRYGRFDSGEVLIDRRR